MTTHADQPSDTNQSLGSLPDYWSMLMRRRFTVAGVFAIVSTTVVLGSFLIPPTYRAQTTIMVKHGREFFYRAAVDRAKGEPVDAQPFRYGGPKPRTREAGIVLLADTVEAASRTLDEPTSARITKLVHDLAMRRLLDGQFDESGLTLRDLRTIEDSFVKVLTSMFHTRVAYPSAPPAARAGAPRAGASR